MSNYFRRRYKRFDGDINVKVDLSNYATKTDLKNVSHVDVSSFALKSNLASLKTEVDKIDADKLKTVPVDLAKLSNVVKNDVVKKTEYNKLVTKVDNIDITNFVKKKKYMKKMGQILKIKSTKSTKKYLTLLIWLKKTDFNTKVTEMEGKIPDVSSLVTKSALTIVENKIPDVSSLVKKIDYNTKISEIENKVNNHNHDKYITTSEFNTMAADVFKARLAAQTDLIRKPDFDSRLKKISDRVAKNKTKHLLVENELKILKTFDSSYFLGKNYFEGNDGVFQTMQKHFKLINENQVDKWKSQGLSNQYLSTFGTIAHVILSKPIKPMHVIFKGKGTLVQDENDIISGGPIINIYSIYKTSPKTVNSNFVFRDCLFGAIKITNTTNSDTDKWQYSGLALDLIQQVILYTPRWRNW